MGYVNTVLYIVEYLFIIFPKLPNLFFLYALWGFYNLFKLVLYDPVNKFLVRLRQFPVFHV